MEPRNAIATLDSQSHLDRCVIALYWQYLMFSDDSGNLINPQFDRAVFLFKNLLQAPKHELGESEEHWERWWKTVREPPLTSISFSQLLSLHRAGPGLSELIRTKREFQKHGAIGMLNIQRKNDSTKNLDILDFGEGTLHVSWSKEFGNPEFFEMLFKGTVGPSNPEFQHRAITELTAGLADLRSKISSLRKLKRYHSLFNLALAEIGDDLKRLESVVKEAQPQKIESVLWSKHLDAAVRSMYLQRYLGWTPYKAAGTSSDMAKTLERTIATIRSRPWHQEFEAPKWSFWENYLHLISSYALITQGNEYEAKIRNEIKSLSLEFRAHMGQRKVKGEK